MRKIIQYYLAEDIIPDDFSRLVTNSIQEGWELYGSPACTYDSIDDATRYIQALVKYENDSLEALIEKAEKIIDPLCLHEWVVIGRHVNSAIHNCSKCGVTTIDAPVTNT